MGHTAMDMTDDTGRMPIVSNAHIQRNATGARQLLVSRRQIEESTLLWLHRNLTLFILNHLNHNLLNLIMKTVIAVVPVFKNRSNKIVRS